VIRTVLGDIAPENLGVTYLHEHLIIDSEIVAKDFPHIHLPSVDEAVSELDLCKSAGINSMVDCMPTGSGRDIRKLVSISEKTGINIIAATGLHPRALTLSRPQMLKALQIYLFQRFKWDVRAHFIKPV